MTIRAIIISIIVVIMSINVFAVPHKSGKLKGPVEMVRKSVITDSRLMRVISKSEGEKKIAVILVNFKNGGRMTSGGQKMTRQDIAGVLETFEYLKGFYKEASYSKYTLDFTYFHAGGKTDNLTGNELPIELNADMSHYGTGDESGDGNGLNSLIIDSVKTVNNSSIILSSAAYEAVIVVHAGYGNESTWNYGDIWSAFIQLYGECYGFVDGMTVPAREFLGSPIGPTCHEFGHMMGLPDLYCTLEGSSRVGVWCLMDMGAWLNDGKNPAAPSVWCKEYLGWINPKIATKYEQINHIAPINEPDSSAYKIFLDDEKEEYFLICYVKQSVYNPMLPGEGILIWHIDHGVIAGQTFDERILENSINNYEHNTVDIVSAGYDRPSSYPFGTKDDPWPGDKEVFESPESNTYNGRPSNIKISNISFSSGRASLSITNLLMDNDAKINSVINYPNPAGPGFSHPRNANGTVTTISFVFSSLASDKELTIYNLAGDTVRKIYDNEISLRLDISSNYQFVYEYDWDGKNAYNENVGQGVYFYRIKTNSDSKTGKLVIIR